VSQDQFDTLVAEYHGEIYKYLLVINGRAVDAHDLSQETFVQAFKRCRSAEPVAGARPWLFGIATELSRRRLRSRRRPARRSIEIDRVATDGHWRHPITLALMRLSAEQRIALALRRLHDFDHQGIGRMLGCSSDRARDRVVQGFRTLARLTESRSRRVAPV